MLRPPARFPPAHVVSARGALIVFALLLAPMARATLPDAAGDTWVEAKSARFTVYSNAGQQAAVRAARHLERLADVLKATTQGLRVDGGREVRVYLFRDLASFKPYRPMGDDETGITAGFQVTGPDVALIAYHVPPQGDPTRFASHEYLHVVLGRNLGLLPVWLNEGLAEYYSTFSAGRRTADIGRPIAEHIAWLQVNGTVPLRQLMLVDANSPDYNEGRRRGTTYAESWAMVHMLAMSPGAEFSRLLSAIGRGVEPTVALNQAYGTNGRDSLSSALDAYVKLGSYRYTTYTFNDDLADVPTQVHELSPAEVLTVLGELALRSKRSLLPLAREHLAAAWRADSSSGIPAGLLCEAADDGSGAPAMTRWAAAIERAPKADPRARALAGIALAMRPFEHYRPTWPAVGADANALNARRLLDVANDARPGRAEWLIPFGLTFVEDTASLALGTSALLTAHESEPQRGDATGALSMLQARAGNRAGAQALYQQIRRSAEFRAWKYWAGYLVMRRTLDDAEKMFKAGKEAQAETLLVRLKRDVQEQGVASAADHVLEWMHDRNRKAEAPAGELASALPPGQGAKGAGGDTTGAAQDRKEAGMRYFEDGSTAIPAALEAAKRGDFAGAEQIILDVRKSAPPALRAGLDSMATEMRNQARLRNALELLRSGKAVEACALYEQVAADHPKPDVREYVMRQRAKYCASGKPK